MRSLRSLGGEEVLGVFGRCFPVVGRQVEVEGGRGVKGCEGLDCLGLVTL